ncbi:hypothetical protein [Gallaecimonas xiamenensis]|uniref:Methyl-accepting chemotaxis protein n=1 Tax=Gallaecimonas xiamenensis 3-C-1 TaxID=745411 RepID=K2JSA8_9GAMM|nr:hypothetical protein [Gallaecimonas xiamenensis]EKE77397.1 hypothetical protein B3C1_01260 [Gallaecimonas xiamenensis 3-C-1]
MDKDVSFRPSRRPRFDNSELTKTGFWVGQVFMLIATVMGVYLAAQQGLAQAIAFDDLDDQQNNYYLRRSLHDELADNIQVIRDYTATLEKEKPYHLDRYHPQLQFYVWDAMRYNPNTLQTPSQFLSGVRRYYAEIQDIISKGEQRTYGVHFYINLLREKTDAVEKSTLKDMADDIGQLKLDLKKAGVDVD